MLLIDSIIICVTIQSEYLELKKPWPRIIIVNGNYASRSDE